MVRFVAAAVVALSVFAPVGTASADPGGITEPAAVLRVANRVGPQVSTVPVPRSVPQFSAEMQAVLDLVNVERTSRGLVPLRLSSKLNDAAQAHTLKQAADGAIYHTDPDDGSNPGQRISRTGYLFSTWAENVAAGFATPRAVVDALMASPGHCRNILAPGVTELGVGYVTGGVKFNQFWTQKFARPAGAPVPAGTYDPAWC